MLIDDIRDVLKLIVYNIEIMNEGIKCVVIRHGSYITTYFGLKSVSVKTGDKVSKKQKRKEQDAQRSNNGYKGIM